MAEYSDSVEWYVVHTYSGYENKVKANLEKSVENNGMQDLIQEVKIPVEDVVEIKNGKRRVVHRKIYPGYVMIKMKMTDDAWYIVRNTRGVTGFVGPGSRPIPLAESEIEASGMNREPVQIDLAVGENVRVLSGPLENFTGKIEDIDTIRQMVKLVVSMFGRETPVELEYDQVLRI